MSESGYAVIDRDELARKLEQTAPNHEDERRGYALVNVLGPQHFARERIPGSINIPQGDENVYERHFDKGKEIILYCASPECDASENVARKLADRGFRRIVDYEDGLSDWREAGKPLAGTNA